jgi:beta-lactam-binding protein with PASTA domain
MSILLAQAPPAPEFVMPNFVGRQLSEAREKIVRAGLQIASVSVAGEDITPPAAPETTDTSQAVAPQKAAPVSGKIIAQSPAAGSRVTAETQIRFQIIP